MNDWGIHGVMVLKNPTYGVIVGEIMVEGKKRLIGVILICLGIGTIFPLFITSSFVSVIIGGLLIITGLYLFNCGRYY